MMAGKTWFLNVKEKGSKKAGSNINKLKKDVNGLGSAAKKLALVFGVGFLGKQIFDV